MITEISGNLLDLPNGINVVAHCANTLNIMGGGVAAQIKARYPEAYQADCDAADEEANNLGDYSVAKLTRDGKKIVIFNLYGQEDIGTNKRQLNYEAIYTAMSGMRSAIEAYVRSDTYTNSNNPPYVLGIPALMGCGLAGGDWLVVRAMIQSVFRNAPFNVVIVQYKQ